MFSQSPQILPETLFQTIYRFAKANDEKGLASLMKKTGGCIGVFEGEYNAVMLSAKEGNKKAVNILIDKFSACLNDAVQGYAIGGYEAEVDELISKGGNIDFALRGYVLGGHHQKAKEFISRGANLKEAVRAYAKKGYVKEVENLISQGASIDQAVYGYALGEYVAQVDNLILHGASIANAVSGYATVGNVVQVEKLLSKFKENINFAIFAYARGGYIAQVEDLIARFKVGITFSECYFHPDKVNDLISQFEKSLEFAVSGYAFGGNVARVKDLIARFEECIDHAVAGYKTSGYEDKAKDLIARFKNNPISNLELSALKGYALGGHEDQVSLIEQDENLLIRFAYLAVLYYVQAGQDDKVSKFILRDNGVNISIAAMAYAQAGRANMVEKYIANGADLSNVIKGYAMGGFIDQVEILYLQDNSLLPAAIDGYKAMHNFKNQQSVLEILSLTKDISLRHLLADSAKKENNSLDTGFLLDQAVKLSQLMNVTQINFNQAQSLSKCLPELQIWFLQGIQLVKDKKFLPELFIYISTFLVGLSTKQTKNLFYWHQDKMSQKLLGASNLKIEEKFKKGSSFGGTLFSLKEYKDEKQKAMDRFENRKAFRLG